MHEACIDFLNLNRLVSNWRLLELAHHSAAVFEWLNVLASGLHTER